MRETNDSDIGEGKFFDGVIDGVVVYNDALSSQDIASSIYGTEDKGTKTILGRILYKDGYFFGDIEVWFLELGDRLMGLIEEPDRTKPKEEDL